MLNVLLALIPADIQLALSDHSLARRFPQAGVYYLHDRTIVQVQPDGRATRRVSVRYKILNADGQQNYSEVRFAWRPDFQTISVDHARAYPPDGGSVELTPAAMRDATPPASSPAYDRYLIRTFTLPATTPGTVVDYQVTLKDKKPLIPSTFSDHVVLQNTEPTRQFQYQVQLPATLALTHHVRNDERSSVAYQNWRQGTDVIHQWTLNDTPPVAVERLMPRWRDVLPHLSVSTAGQWDQMARWWQQITKGKAEPTPELTALAKRLTQTARTPRDKVQKLYEYVISELRYVAVDLSYVGLEPQDAHAVWRNRFGDCKDGATLLIALMKAAGLPGWYALVSTNERGGLDQEVPSLAQFDHCIAVTEIDGKPLFLDTTAASTPFGVIPGMDQGATAWVLKGDRSEFQTIPYFDDNWVETRQDLTLDEAGRLTGEVREIFGGTLAARERATYAADSESQLVNRFVRAANRFVSGSRLIDYSLTPPSLFNQPFSTRFRFEAENGATRAGDLMIVQLPATNYGLGIFNASQRRFPLKWGTVERYVDTATLQVPRGWRPRYLPQAVRVDDPHVGFSGEYTFQNGVITYRAVTDYRKRTIPAAAYGSLKLLFERRARFGREVIVLERVDG